MAPNCCKARCQIFFKTDLLCLYTPCYKNVKALCSLLFLSHVTQSPQTLFRAPSVASEPNNPKGKANNSIFLSFQTGPLQLKQIWKGVREEKNQHHHQCFSEITNPKLNYICMTDLFSRSQHMVHVTRQ